MKKINLKLKISKEELRKKLDVKDGVPGLDSVIPGPQGESGKNGSPDTPSEVRDKLETLKDDERLDIAAIKGFDSVISDIKKSGNPVKIGGGSRGVQLYVDGAKKGLAQFINIVSGSGIIVADTLVNGLHSITITGSGFGGNVEQPIGTINGVNVTFTVSNQPKWIVIDGGTTLYPSDSVTGLSYMYVAGTITVNSERAPTLSIKSFY